MVSEVDEGQIHVVRTPGGVQRSVHDDDGGLHDASGERCLLGAKCLLDEMSGDEICEAYQGPDSEVERDGTCLHGRATFVGMGFVVLMSSKVAYDVPVQNAVRGLGQESVLVEDGGEQSLGQLDVHDVHVDVQFPAHVLERVWKSYVR